MEFNGKILIDDAVFIASGTTIDGPLLTSMSSEVELYDSYVTNIPVTPTNVDHVYPYPFAISHNATNQVDYLFERNPDASKVVVPVGQETTALIMNDSANVTLASGEDLSISGFDIGGLVFNGLT